MRGAGSKIIPIFLQQKKHTEDKATKEGPGRRKFPHPHPFQIPSLLEVTLLFAKTPLVEKYLSPYLGSFIRSHVYRKSSFPNCLRQEKEPN